MRFHRAMQMDASNKINKKPTHFWTASLEWTDAYKATLSSNKQKQFDKIWKKLEDNLEYWHNATPKEQANMKNPFDAF